MGVEGVEPRPGHKVGIARDFRPGVRPINGLRHPAEGDTTGWYIWDGQREIPQEEAEFFVALHAEHLKEYAPEVLKFLALPPGWRFLKAGDYEDVWYDPKLLNI